MYVISAGEIETGKVVLETGINDGILDAVLEDEGTTMCPSDHGRLREGTRQ